MSDKNDVKITNEEMDELLAWIKSGKTFKQIGRLINKKIKGQPVTDDESTEPKQPRVRAARQDIDYGRLADAIASKEPIVNLSIECTIGNDKKINLGGAEPLSGRDFITAHEELYLRLLSSLENIIALSK